MRFCLAIITFAALGLGCGQKASEGGVQLEISYHYLSARPGCVVAGATPDMPSGQTNERGISTTTADGNLKVGLVPTPGWSGGLTVFAELHQGSCTGATLATDSQHVAFPAAGKVTTAMLSVSEPAIDGGGGGSGGGGGGGGSAAGGGSATGGGSSSGGGSAAGGGSSTGGGSAAGGGSSSGGGSAVGGGSGTGGGGGGGGGSGTGGGSGGGGASGCGPNLNFSALGVANGSVWNDLSLFAGGAYVVSDNSNDMEYSDGGNFTPPANACNGLLLSSWARSDGRLYVAGTGFGIHFYDPPTATCPGLVADTTFTGAGSLTALTGVNGGTTLLFGGSDQGWLFSATDPASLAPTQQVASAHWYGADSFGSAAPLVMVSGDVNGKRAIATWDAGGPGWDVFVTADNGTLHDVSILDGTTAFAGGDNGAFYAWDAGQWQQVAGPNFTILGVKALSPSLVYAVGGGKDAVAVWDGGTWATSTLTSSNSQHFNRVRASGCDVWVAGTSGGVERTGP